MALFDRLAEGIASVKARRPDFPIVARCVLQRAPWVSAVIEADQTVRPCNFHPPIGNLRGRSLISVLNSSAPLVLPQQSRHFAQSGLPKMCVPFTCRQRRSATRRNGVPALVEIKMYQRQES